MIAVSELFNKCFHKTLCICLSDAKIRIIGERRKSPSGKFR
ncbi:hypothetical protein M085_3367 [Bacteroides fragilis str. 3986 N(B)19]|nr:hypothetical protein M085_3367 [Bacteroides fragilis str. 3986 N(B)19]